MIFELSADAPEHGDRIAVKHLFGQFIDHIEISTDWQTHPTYLIRKRRFPSRMRLGNQGRRFVLRTKRGAEGTRTPDPLHAMEVRYQLRHSPWITREADGTRPREAPAV